MDDKTDLERAEEWVDDRAYGRGITDTDIANLAQLFAAVRREERERALAEAASAVCFYCAEGCEIATTTAGGHELPYDGPWHVNDIDPNVLSRCEARRIRAPKVSK